MDEVLVEFDTVKFEKKLNGKTSKETYNYFANKIRSVKQELKKSKDFSGDFQQVFSAYESICKKRSFVDFSDMIPLALDLLKKYEFVLLGF